MKEIAITDIEGIRIGHAQDLDAATGCTVVIGKEGLTAGVDVRGGAPGTRETDLLNPVNLVEQIHAVVLTGGSSFGLDAASGVMQYLEERNIGFDAVVTKIPIVCGAVLFDLTIGDHKVRPDKKMGYEACLNANDTACAEGCVGAGTGATVGKILGMERCMKGGLGAYCLQAGDLKVGAIVAVNCLGDVIDPRTGETLAGVLDENRSRFLNSEEIMIREFASRKIEFGGNTTIGVIATNARLTKSQANKVASMAHDGYGRTMRPAHSMFDGDTIFAISTGSVETDVNVVGLLAARTMEQAVIRAVKKATPLCGVKSCSEVL
ncbi:MAG: P1 family peptidase [Proteobacteria bacterium]|nr:P1 family peptidase [Desulfobacterales bacterium]MBL6967714.1 P1 family peptidase [Desulfobacteraceae bacterium]MBL7101692.1 P1 family peptidase [Desulfobacteraceae bacterium]MBL7172350.1 P1 family peptidase [Desulfobacteraceae bacterium]MBU1904165.1 P1 family peptidase [Pseudomonadota bacterium]